MILGQESKGWALIGLVGILIGGSAVWLGAFVEPSIHVELALSSSHLIPNQLVEVNVTMTNRAWVTSARHLQVEVSFPNGVTNSITGTNQCDFTFAALLGSQRVSESFTISLTTTPSYGRYYITLAVYGENVPLNLTRHLITMSPQSPDIS